MIDIDILRKNPDDVADNLSKRGVTKEDIQQLLEFDQKWRSLTALAEELRAEQNKANDKIAQAEAEEKKDMIQSMKKISEDLRIKQQELEAAKQQRDKAWRSLPNILISDVQSGGEDDAKVLHYVPEEMHAGKPVTSYLELTEPDLIDTVRAAKVSGSRFGYIKGDLARLQIALVSFVFDQLREHNFIPVIPPVMVSTEAMSAMGYMDNHADEIYQTQDNLCLVGTSEQSIGPMHKDETFTADKLPLRYVGYSSCFRREVGSHGKDVKGILRVHQFEKIEMFSITAPSASENEHEFLLKQQESLMQALELPYRVVQLAAGDLGAPSAKTYDIETWIPSESRYRETHSTSNTTDYQSRRLNIKVKNTDGVTTKVHMLNGTALAIPRILIALIENHLQPDDTVAIPKALQPYLPFTSIKLK